MRGSGRNGTELPAGCLAVLNAISMRRDHGRKPDLHVSEGALSTPEPRHTFLRDAREKVVALLWQEAAGYASPSLPHEKPALSHPRRISALFTLGFLPDSLTAGHLAETRFRGESHVPGRPLWLLAGDRLSGAAQQLQGPWGGGKGAHSPVRPAAQCSA